MTEMLADTGLEFEKMTTFGLAVYRCKECDFKFGWNDKQDQFEYAVKLAKQAHNVARRHVPHETQR